VINFIHAENLALPWALQSAKLAYEAFVDFYSIFSGDKEKIIYSIAEQFNTFSELNQVVLAVEEGNIVGICSYYKAEERLERQVNGIRSLLEISDILPEVNEGLRNFQKKFSEYNFQKNTIYISRFSIKMEKRGQALGLNLMKHIESYFISLKIQRILLHVRRDNIQAIMFYKKVGFTDLDHCRLGYVLLEKIILS
jgi:ribosomal protein S18 acetylase RimI-like enzyme